MMKGCLDMMAGVSRCVGMLLLLVALAGLGGCSGVQTYPAVSRAGDTVTLAAGRRLGFSRDTVTVTITPSAGTPVVIPPGDPAIRAVFNLYPDPLSSLRVSAGIDQDLTPAARSYGTAIEEGFSGGDGDWWQTVVFVDLPAWLPAGNTRVEVSNPAGESVTAELLVIAGTGQPEDFEAELNGPLTPEQLAGLARVPHYTVRFSGSVVPHAIQVECLHDPDADNGGQGRAWVVNPRGDIKSLLWRDDGTRLRVLLTPAGTQPLQDLNDFKFYVAGGLSGLQVVEVRAVDGAGNPVPGITAVIE